MSIEQTIVQMARDAKKAAFVLGRCDTPRKNQTLLTMADLLEQQADAIFRENRRDLERAEASRSRYLQL